MKTYAATLLLVIAIGFLPTSAQATIDSRGNLFLQMMLTMMDIMGFIDRDDDYYDVYPRYQQLMPMQPFQQISPQMNPQMTQQWQSMLQALALQQMLNSANPGMLSGGTGMLPGITSNSSWLDSGSRLNPLNPLNPLTQQLPNQLGNQLPGQIPSNQSFTTQAVIPFLPEYFNQPQVQQSQVQQSQIQHRKYKPHWIEGRWLSSDGMIMEVRQGQFKMYYRNDPKNVRGGLIRMKDKWLAIHELTNKMTRQYEFAHEKGYLALKDTNGSGQIMVFKRLQDWPAIPLNNPGTTPFTGPVK